MLAIAWLIVKAALLLIIMAIRGKLHVYFGVMAFCLGLEETPSSIRRFRWLAWGGCAVGAVIILCAGLALPLLIFA